MADILIKGIDMPKGNNVLIVDSAGTINILNKWTGKREAINPLKVKAIELPTHGDLIDDPVKFRTIMEHLSRDKINPAAAHEAMDDYMCKVLEQLGYTEGVKFFKASDRCYA